MLLVSSGPKQEIRIVYALRRGGIGFIGRAKSFTGFIVQLKKYWSLKRMANVWNADMTLGQAIRMLTDPPWACACCGPPMARGKVLDSRCFCLLAIDQAYSLKRAADIIAILLSDHATINLQEMDE